MIPASHAGVAFSADPVAGRRDRVVVSATQGLGDRLVAGEVDKAPVGLKTAPMTVNPLGEHIFRNKGHQRRDPFKIGGQGLCLAFIPEVERCQLLEQSVIEHEQPPGTNLHPTPIYVAFLP